jgi:hypothetical protein
MSLRTPLSRVRGLGTSGEVTGEWWAPSGLPPWP